MSHRSAKNRYEVEPSTRSTRSKAVPQKRGAPKSRVIKELQVEGKETEPVGQVKVFMALMFLYDRSRKRPSQPPKYLRSEDGLLTSRLPLAKKTTRK